MGLLSIAVQMGGKRCLVVGGGRIAARKAAKALAAGAEVVSVSPEFDSQFIELGKIFPLQLNCVSRCYEHGEAGGYDLVFAAAAPEVNRQVVADAAGDKVWVNDATDEDGGGFILPAVLEQGELAVAVSGGGSPALSKTLRDEIGKIITPWHGCLAHAMGKVRRRLRAGGCEGGKRRQIMRWLARKENWQSLCHLHQVEELEEALWKMAGEEIG